MCIIRDPKRNVDESETLFIWRLTNTWSWIHGCPSVWRASDTRRWWWQMGHQAFISLCHCQSPNPFETQVFVHQLNERAENSDKPWSIPKLREIENSWKLDRLSGNEYLYQVGMVSGWLAVCLFTGFSCKQADRIVWWLSVFPCMYGLNGVKCIWVIVLFMR